MVAVVVVVREANMVRNRGDTKGKEILRRI